MRLLPRWLPRPQPPPGPKPAPIYNPYDKFTKPQFDAWIDDLTGTLRRALGHIDDGGREESLVASDESSMGHIDAEQASESSEVDGDIEDSFAELKARRANRKGKARDPREGPGLFPGRGNGSYEEPIDLASDSEDEEAQVEELARVIDDTDYGSEWEEQDELEQGEQDAEDVDLETDAEVDYEDEENHEEAGSNLEEGNEAYDEDEDEEQLDLWKTDQSSSPLVQYEVFDADDEDHVEKSDEPEVIELLSDEEISIAGSSPSARGESEEHSDEDIDEEDWDRGAHVDAPVSPNVYDVDDDNEQPLYNDTGVCFSSRMCIFEPNFLSAFPSTVLGYPFLHEPVEIMDPWVRPQQYANDLYKGGDHLPGPETHPSPHQLGETDVTSTSITPQREADESTVLFEVSCHKSPEAATHLRSPFNASYLQYDPDSIGSTNKEEYYANRNVHRQTVTSLFPNEGVVNRRPDEQHPDTHNDVTALDMNLEGPRDDNMEGLIHWLLETRAMR
ncbi:hypothetical protein IW261DRAFT_781702 [Armillaria novae-zelandiae]|uniref:Uncharacterized protein n=1 Tax=Armillaria novae-zelandiae TaxID=153914 RepID=A0AA39UEF2_9AGAR|nr:hypothetical protein IW261DRAFT_781702 [Armillaria novae-zelandiae]